MKKLTLLFTSALLMGACSQQTPEAAPQDPASTIVNADSTVTFTYRNDHAKKVQVDVQFAGRHDMERDSITGLWTCTLGPAEPDMYPYCFVVDGVSIMDPKCNEWFPNEGFKNSLLDIPGTNGPLVHAVQRVPHGNVDYVTYWSEAIGAYNQALVYTPASYASGNKDYPVFYLISGTTDTEEVYYKVGRMNVIADNLIAEGKAEEMIIVLPYGNPAKLINQPMSLGEWGDLFGKDLHGSLMPYVESHYRTINDADHRAIGGFSRGGNQALSNGLMHLDKFSYLCSYSSFTSTELPKVYDNAKKTNEKINLFWLGIGVDDFLYKTSHDYLEFLDKKGIRHCMEFTEGKFGHTWMNAKYFLSHTLQLLFNKEASAQAMKNGIEPMPALKGDEKPFTPGVMARLFPRAIVSPEYGEQGTVTLRFKAPEAKEVKVAGEMLSAPQAMECDSDGVWSITLSGIEPDVYCYNFIVDSTEVMDPVNMYLAPDNGFKRSILEMPGAPYSVNNAQVKYSPVTIKTDCKEGARYAVCGYGEKKLYLIAGGNDTFESWIKIGHANQILDQLVAAGECQPCQLIMTDDASREEVCTSSCNKSCGKQQKVDNQLNSSDFATWKDCRKALVEKLKTL
ncbi:MAG: alpha/beta hydrolase-fold protein [Bacteroidales bacterium]|nr:alpha/beta hydrolase-fold protein [Bacteroidales bacterium]